MVMTTLTTLPSGQRVNLPPSGTSWTAQSSTTRGTPLTADLLERDVTGSVMFHRQRALFQCIHTAAISVPTSTWTSLRLDTEIIDQYGGHLDAGNTGRWYAPITTNVTDWYLAIGHIPWTGNATGVRIAGVRLNGGGTIYEGMKVGGTAAHQIGVQFIDLVEMDANGGGYAELMGYQTSGANLSTVASGKTPSLTMRWVATGSTGVAPVALPAPRTWSSTDVLSSSSSTGGRVPLNTHIRDIVRWLEYPPIARITSQGSLQTIPTGASWTSIQMPTMTVDNYGAWSSGANTKLTCQRPGVYYVAGLGNVGDTAANVGYRAARLLHTKAAGGTSIYGGASSVPAPAGTTGTAVYATGFIRLAVGDTVEVQMQQTQGAALSVTTLAGNACKLLYVWMSL